MADEGITQAELGGFRAPLPAGSKADLHHGLGGPASGGDDECGEGEMLCWFEADYLTPHEARAFAFACFKKQAPQFWFQGHAE